MSSAEETLRSLTDALSGLSVSSRKPELPAFDKANIDIWIKRVESAFTRANVTLAKNKFAHLEAKISVDEDPRINEYLFNSDPDDDTWTAFTSYLRRRHGRTTQQRAAIVLEGVRRDGRTPSELFAVLKERVGNITIDDLLKEMVVRELPSDIQRTIWEKSQTLDGLATSELADQFFNKDGQPIHRSTNSSVNAVVDDQRMFETHLDEDTDVNALGARAQRGADNDNKARRNQQRPTVTKRSSTPSRQQSFGSDSYPMPKPGEQCRFHQKFGKEARRCLPGCPLFKNDPKAEAPRRA